jgi:hypothetical protein
LVTYRKGILISEDDIYEHIEHTPSWAPNVSSRILVQPKDGYDELIGVSLAIKNHIPSYNLIDFDLSDTEDVPCLVIRHPDRDRDNEEWFPI